MHTIVILTETMDIDQKLVNGIKEMFPECTIEFRLKASGKKDAATPFRREERKVTKCR